MVSGLYNTDQMSGLTDPERSPPVPSLVTMDRRIQRIECDEKEIQRRGAEQRRRVSALLPRCDTEPNTTAGRIVEPAAARGAA